MSCSCKNKNKSGNSIRPYDYCLFCAEKHASLAYGQLKENSYIFPYRQLAIGELQLSKHHLNDVELRNDLDEFSFLLSHKKAVDFDKFETFLFKISSFIDATIEKEKQGKASSVKGKASFDYDYNESIVEAEKAFCVAWRMAEECGYESINRNFVIERLTVSQIRIYKIDYGIAEDIRDIRHLVQYRREPEIGIRWINVLKKFDALNREEDKNGELK